MEKQKQRCKKCSSTLIYFRISKQERVCRSCGYIEKIKEKLNDAGEKLR